MYISSLSNAALANEEKSETNTGWPKMAHFLYVLTSSNIDRFRTYFTVRIRRTLVIILSLKIPPHLKCVSVSLHYLVKCQYLKSNRRLL